MEAVHPSTHTGHGPEPGFGGRERRRSDCWRRTPGGRTGVACRARAARGAAAPGGPLPPLSATERDSRALPSKGLALALADGTGVQASPSASAVTPSGEVVFQHRADRLQEILTDPELLLPDRHADLSAHRQTPASTSRTPNRRRCSWLIVRDAATASNFRSERSLPELVADQGTVAIADIDTRQLTRRLRTTGAPERLHRRPEAGAAAGTGGVTIDAVSCAHAQRH